MRKGGKGIVYGCWMAVALLTAVVVAAPKAPSVSAEDKLKIREFQLKDSRFAASIKQHQLEIVNIQQQQLQNANDFRGLVSGLCKDESGKYEFDMSSDVDLKCVEKKPSPTPTPTPAPAAK